MATITGSEVLAKALRTQGVDTMFYLMGGPMLETEAACIPLGIRAIDHRHEQAASFAAHAWTRVMRRPGVCMGCSGPGATNLVTGVATAFTDCAPLVAIGGASPRVYQGMEAFQEIDQLSVMKPITKWAERIFDAKRIPDVVATAFRQATTGRPGPVYIDMPGDILGEKVEEESIHYAPAWKPAPRTLGDPAAVKEAIALLARAERPVVIAGSGVWWSDGAAALQAFVEATGIPFYTKPISRGLIPEDHALSFLNARSKAFTEADVVLAVGTRFDWMIQFGRPPRFAADLKVIHVDINPSQLGHNREVDVPIAGDARAVLEQLRAEAEGKINPRLYAGWTGKLDAGRREVVRDGQGDEQRQHAHPSAAPLQGGARLPAARRHPGRRRPGDPELRPPGDPDLRARPPAQLRGIRHHGRRPALRRGRQGRQARHPGARAARRRLLRHQRHGHRHGRASQDPRRGP